MFTLSIVTIAIIIGIGFGLAVSASDRRKLRDAESELAKLRCALDEKQLEVDQSNQMHQKTMSIAYSVVLDYETIFDEMKKRNNLNRSAVILPFDRNLER